ncbi:unnamed protein product [Cylindrotheca closterium]|uniref:Peptidase M11 gametolysin domain-containing protein n=1 Tax=Cylindrotheca closterium TaxID=2856 RepID=A0AAD2FKI6_9STRA|nr:unnamed protein product [Cylindrotheca closterium]
MRLVFSCCWLQLCSHHTVIDAAVILRLYAKFKENEQNLPCTLYNAIVEYEDGSDTSEWMCEVIGPDAKNAGSKWKYATLSVEGMEFVLKANPNIQSGRTTLLAQGARFNNIFAQGSPKQKLVISGNNKLTFGEADPEDIGERRRLSSPTGDLSILVVRVTTSDASLTKQKAEISGDFFGTTGSGDTINLKSLVEGCSNNVATINPGSGTGSFNVGCQDNVDAIFDVQRSDPDTTYNCDWFTRYRFSTPGDLCYSYGYGDAIQIFPTVDATKTAKTECCICGRTEETIVTFDNDVQDGVMDLQLPINAVGNTHTTLENAAVEELKSLFSVDRLDSLFDNVMLCLPKGSYSNGDTSQTNWLAYAYIGGSVSVFNGDKWCANEVTQLHELGHNWRLQHASQGTATYGDLTGAMGSTYGRGDDVAEGNRMCFNGAHSWQLGWYTQYNLEIDPLATNFDGTLVGADRVPNVLASENVVLKLVNSQEDYYLIFNHAVGANDGTTEADNRVTITTKTTNSAAKTFLIGDLSQGASMTFSAWAGTAESVTVLVTSIDTAAATGNAKVEVWKGLLGDRPSSVPTPTPPPTSAPVSNPSSEPSGAPSSVPTPTPPPTSAPVSNPSSEPSGTPSSVPTPTPPPTSGPTSNPSSEPSGAPSSVPTPTPPPTSAPVSNPSSEPSGTPSSVPTPTPPPTSAPVSNPSSEPSGAPSSVPTPTPPPTSAPTFNPSSEPSGAPSSIPTPTPPPTSAPSLLPTNTPPGNSGNGGGGGNSNGKKPK